MISPASVVGNADERSHVYAVTDGVTGEQFDEAIRVYSVQKQLGCPRGLTRHQSGDPGVHELCFPVPGLDDGEATVVLGQGATEVAGISVYLPRASLTGRQALNLAEALANAAAALLPERQASQVEVVQVLPDLVALREALGGLCVVDADVPTSWPARAHLVSGGHGLVLYAFGNPEHVVLPAAEARDRAPGDSAVGVVRGRVEGRAPRRAAGVRREAL